MKLSTLKIYETLTYSEVKNIPNLTKAMNRHMDINATTDAVRDMARNGVDGPVGDIMAFELGLHVEGFVPVYGRKNTSKKKPAPRSKVKSSKYKGVYAVKNSRKWKASISVLGVRNDLGRFDSELEAAAAYNEVAAAVGRVVKEVVL